MQTLTHLPACTEQISALCMYIETLKMPLASIHPPPLLPGIWRGGDQICGVWNNMTHQHLRDLVHLPCLTHTPKAHIHAWVINPNRQQNLLPLERVVDLWDADVCLKHCSILRAWRINLAFTLIVDTYSLSLSLCHRPPLALKHWADSFH